MAVCRSPLAGEVALARVVEAMARSGDAADRPRERDAVAMTWLSFNSGFGWGVWHKPMGRSERPVRTIGVCAREIPAKARLCWSENPPVEQRCKKCIESEGPSGPREAA